MPQYKKFTLHNYIRTVAPNEEFCVRWRNCRPNGNTSSGIDGAGESSRALDMFNESTQLMTTVRM